MADRNLSENSRRIARNTVLLYFRMFLLMAVGLYTSRVVLHALGVDDYGVYNAVAGVVTLFTILTGSMTAAISRFLTYQLGKAENDLKSVFSTAIGIQWILAAVILLLTQSVGLWWLQHKMVIPPDRMNAAYFVLLCSAISMIIQLVSVPYTAAIIAHERMDAFAWISIFEGVGKLGVALFIASFGGDRLILYAQLLLVVCLLVRIAYGWFCRRHFEEVRGKRKIDFALFKEMFAFAGWNFIGSGSGILRDQGGNQLLNLFFGPAVNAAWGLAAQVNSAVQKFVTSFTTAINPQITKSWANGEHDYMMSLIFRGSRISVYLLLLVILPVLFHTQFLVDLWLKEIPAHTILFIRLVLVYLLIESVSYTMVTAMLSTGDIRNYQLLVGGLQLLNLPIDYVLLKCGANPEVIYWVAIGIALLCLTARVYMLRGMIGLPVGRFLKEVLGRELLVTGAALAAPLLLVGKMGTGWTGFLLSVAVMEIATLACIWVLGTDKTERAYVRSKLSRK